MPAPQAPEGTRKKQGRLHQAAYISLETLRTHVRHIEPFSAPGTLRLPSQVAGLVSTNHS